MKKAFSLLELIFAIVVLGIIASFAVPKYMDTKDQALASTLERDIVSATNSIQNYYLLNRKIDSISDAITLNSKNWTINTTTATIVDNESCLELKVDTNNKKISIKVTATENTICKILDEKGIKSLDIDLI